MIEVHLSECHLEDPVLFLRLSSDAFILTALHHADVGDGNLAPQTLR